MFESGRGLPHSKRHNVGVAWAGGSAFLTGMKLLAPWILMAAVLSSLSSMAAEQAASAPATTAPATAASVKSGTNGVVRSLFDGKTLNGWAITPFAGKGEVRVEKGAIALDQGYLTGVHWTNALPKTNYELSLEARRMQGTDFFCGLTFPIAGTNVSLIVGGWGGGVVGISNIDHNDASGNETTKFMGFTRERWYAIKVRVTPAKLEAWLDKEKIVDVTTEGKTFGLRSGPIEESVPLGICTYETSAEIRNIEIQELPPVPAKP